MKHHASLRRRRFPRTLPVAAACALVLSVGPLSRAAPPVNPLSPPQFSLDLASPSLGGAGQSADDILEPNEPFPRVVVDGSLLGLSVPGSDDLNALSANQADPGAQLFVLLFSVDRATIGATLPDPMLVAAGVPYNVADQAARVQSAADIYMSTLAFMLPAAAAGQRTEGNNLLVNNQYDEGGTSLRVDPEQSADDYNYNPQQSQDDGDGTGEPSDDVGARGAGNPVYFAVKRGSPSLPGLPGPNSGANIYYSADPNQMQTTLYASHLAIGLSDPNNDIDALIVIDNGTPGSIDPNDAVLFSLTPGSPALSSIDGPGAAAYVFIRRFNVAPPPTVFATASQLGLGAEPDVDNVDALNLLLCEDPNACALERGVRRLKGDRNNNGLVGFGDFVPMTGCWSGPEVSLDDIGAATVTISVGAGGFSPANVIVEIGDRVRWGWAPNAGSHRVVSGRLGAPDAGDLFDSGQHSAPGIHLQVDFGIGFLSTYPVPANVYPYFCSVHGDGHNAGAVIVRPHPCAIFDFDEDGDVDFADFSAMQVVASGPPPP